MMLFFPNNFFLDTFLHYIHSIPDRKGHGLDIPVLNRKGMPVLVFYVGSLGTARCPSLLGREGTSMDSFSAGVRMYHRSYSIHRNMRLFKLIFQCCLKPFHFVLFICSHDGC